MVAGVGPSTASDDRQCLGGRCDSVSGASLCGGIARDGVRRRADLADANGRWRRVLVILGGGEVA
jgi:hypothetical protein